MPSLDSSSQSSSFTADYCNAHACTSVHSAEAKTQNIITCGFNLKSVSSSLNPDLKVHVETQDKVLLHTDLTLNIYLTVCYIRIKFLFSQYLGRFLEGTAGDLALSMRSNVCPLVGWYVCPVPILIAKG